MPGSTSSTLRAAATLALLVATGAVSLCTADAATVDLSAVAAPVVVADKTYNALTITVAADSVVSLQNVTVAGQLFIQRRDSRALTNVSLSFTAVGTAVLVVSPLSAGSTMLIADSTIRTVGAGVEDKAVLQIQGAENTTVTIRNTTVENRVTSGSSIARAVSVGSETADMNLTVVDSALTAVVEVAASRSYATIVEVLMMKTNGSITFRGTTLIATSKTTATVYYGTFVDASLLHFDACAVTARVVSSGSNTAARLFRQRSISADVSAPLFKIVVSGGSSELGTVNGQVTVFDIHFAYRSTFAAFVVEQGHRMVLSALVSGNVQLLPSVSKFGIRALALRDSVVTARGSEVTMWDVQHGTHPGLSVTVEGNTLELSGQASATVLALSGTIDDGLVSVKDNVVNITAGTAQATMGGVGTTVRSSVTVVNNTGSFVSTGSTAGFISIGGCTDDVAVTVAMNRVTITGSSVNSQAVSFSTVSARANGTVSVTDNVFTMTSGQVDGRMVGITWPKGVVGTLDISRNAITFHMLKGPDGAFTYCFFGLSVRAAILFRDNVFKAYSYEGASSPNQLFGIETAESVVVMGDAEPTTSIRVDGNSFWFQGATLAEGEATDPNDPAAIAIARKMSVVGFTTRKVAAPRGTETARATFVLVSLSNNTVVAHGAHRPTGLNFLDVKNSNETVCAGNVVRLMNSTRAYAGILYTHYSSTATAVVVDNNVTIVNDGSGYQTSGLQMTVEGGVTAGVRYAGNRIRVACLNAAEAGAVVGIMHAMSSQRVPVDILNNDVSHALTFAAGKGPRQSLSTEAASRGIAVTSGSASMVLTISGNTVRNLAALHGDGMTFAMGIHARVNSGNARVARLAFDRNTVQDHHAGITLEYPRYINTIDFTDNVVSVACGNATLTSTYPGRRFSNAGLAIVSELRYVNNVTIAGNTVTVPGCALQHATPHRVSGIKLSMIRTVDGALRVLRNTARITPSVGTKNAAGIDLGAGNAIGMICDGNEATIADGAETAIGIRASSASGTGGVGPAVFRNNTAHAAATAMVHALDARISAKAGVVFEVTDNTGVARASTKAGMATGLAASADQNSLMRIERNTVTAEATEPSSANTAVGFDIGRSERNLGTIAGPIEGCTVRCVNISRCVAIASKAPVQVSRTTVTVLSAATSAAVSAVVLDTADVTFGNQTALSVTVDGPAKVGQEYCSAVLLSHGSAGFASTLITAFDGTTLVAKCPAAYGVFTIAQPLIRDTTSRDSFARITATFTGGSVTAESTSAAHPSATVALDASHPFPGDDNPTVLVTATETALTALGDHSNTAVAALDSANCRSITAAFRRAVMVRKHSTRGASGDLSQPAVVRLRSGSLGYRTWDITTECATLNGTAVAAADVTYPPGGPVELNVTGCGGTVLPTPAPNTASTPAPVTSDTPAPVTAGTPAPQTSGATPAPGTAATPAPTSATPQPTTAPRTFRRRFRARIPRTASTTSLESKLAARLNIPASTIRVWFASGGTGSTGAASSGSGSGDGTVAVYIEIRGGTAEQQAAGTLEGMSAAAQDQEFGITGLAVDGDGTGGNGNDDGLSGATIAVIVVGAVVVLGVAGAAAGVAVWFFVVREQPVVKTEGDGVLNAPPTAAEPMMYEMHAHDPHMVGVQPPQHGQSPLKDVEL